MVAFLSDNTKTMIFSFNFMLFSSLPFAFVSWVLVFRGKRPSKMDFKASNKTARNNRIDFPSTATDARAKFLFLIQRFVSLEHGHIRYASHHPSKHFTYRINWKFIRKFSISVANFVVMSCVYVWRRYLDIFRFHSFIRLHTEKKCDLSVSFIESLSCTHRCSFLSVV